MKIVKISAQLKRLKNLSDEIRYAECFSEKQFTSGLIAFRRNKGGDPKQIEHADKDVVCHVIKAPAVCALAGKAWRFVRELSVTSLKAYLMTSRREKPASSVILFVDQDRLEHRDDNGIFYYHHHFAGSYLAR